MNIDMNTNNKTSNNYSIIMPPPNVTGVLHMGHALNMTIQDVLIRRAKNCDKDVCWYPGLDHAAIATENKVIDFLKKQGIKKQDLSRDEFLKHCWEWKEKYGSTILDQIKKLNCLCNWDKLTFTLDQKASDIVIDTFVKMYNDGLIYKSTKMINWDSQNKTALSDEEVIYKDCQGQLFYIKYKITDSDEYITVATSRPETIFGDVAICINPNDERYKNIIGKKVIIPMVERGIPIITDEYVDKDFGTGCLKVTPAHDFNDYKLGEKYNLEKINILNEDGTLNDVCGEYCGLDRFEARKQIKTNLEQKGLLEKVEQYSTRVGYSERSNSIVEPRLSEQWFVKMKELAKPALDVVLNNKIKFHPDRFVNIYKSWLENVQDWCISRQLWWGHRIPVYYFGDKCCAAHNIEEAQKIFGCDISEIKQDPDVLDTWFSAGLWPIIVTDGLKEPTDDLVTGPDIIFFWVARMIMMSLYLNKTIPFKNVYFTGIIRDSQGRKMSKSLGNSPDPLDLISKYGSDGVRFGLLLSTQAGNDLKYDEHLCKQGRNFCTKIKNAYRLLGIWEEQVGKINLANIEKEYQGRQCIKKDLINSLLNEISTTKKEMEQKFREYRINEAAMIAYKLFWDRFCSFYLEQAKPKEMRKNNKTIMGKLCLIFRNLLDILRHPGRRENGQIDKTTVEMFYLIFYDLMKILNPFIPEITNEYIEILNKRGIVYHNLELQ